MSDFGSTQLNLEKILSARHEITQQERVSIKEALDVIDTKIKTLISRIGVKPKETLESIAATIRSLEHEHSTTTQSKSDERQFMREVEKLKQKRKLVQDYLKASDELEAYKDKRAELYQELRDKDKTLEELHNGIRKVKTASKLQCSTAEIIEQQFVIPEEAIPRVIGKGGQNFRQIETDFNVSVEAERSGGIIRIMGTETAISKAYGSIMNTVNTSSIEINPPDETIVCLVLNKAAYCQDLQLRHNVRIDVSRAKKLCKITGLANAIASAVVEINLINSCRLEMQIEQSVLPSIVGKGGAVIKSIEEEQRIQLDIFREDNKIVILGFRPDVEKTAKIIQNIIAENKETEESIKANRHVIITCIIGTGGLTARSLQKDLNVGIRVERATDETDLDTIYIRGTTSKVIQAKAYILTLLKEFYSQTCRVEVPIDCLPIIVGKKGSRINSLRDEYPDASIDIEGSVVYIQSPSESSREKIKTIIENLISSNYTQSVQLQADIAISLKGLRGSDLRNLLSATLELGFEIDSDNETIKLRGTQENVEKGVQALEDFKRDNYCEDLSCEGDDCVAFITPVVPEEDSPQKSIEKEFDVDIYVNRKDQLLKIRGQESNVKKAMKAILLLLNGDVSRGSILLPVNKIVFSAIIGKGGATLKKLEADNGVKLDLLKGTGFIRFRGPSDKLLPAKERIISFLDEVKSTVTVECEDTEKVTNKFIETVEALFDVDVSKVENIIIIKGLIRLVDMAQAYVSNYVSRESSVVLQASTPQIALISTDLFDTLESTHHVKINDNDKDTIVITGPLASATEAKDTLIKYLLTNFPNEYLELKIDAGCLREIASHNTYYLETTGANINIDLTSNTLYIFGTLLGVQKVMDIIKQKQTKWSQIHPIIPIEESLLPSFVGKSGSSIVQLEKETKVRIRVNRLEKRLELEGGDEAIIAAAFQTVTQKIESLRARQWEVTLTGDMLGTFIGREGSNIKKFRADTGVIIEVDNKTGLVKISGEPDKVKDAKERIQNFIKEEETNNHVMEMAVPVSAYPFLIGTKGSIAREIQTTSGARLDLDRSRQLVILRGSVPSCEHAVRVIEDILLKNDINLKLLKLEPELPLEVVEEPKEPAKGNKLCPGAPPSLLQKQTEAQLSKSALRRLKRKQQISQSSKIDETIVEEEEELGLSPSSVAAIELTPSSTPVTPIPSKSIGQSNSTVHVSKQVETFSMQDLLIPGFSPSIDELNFTGVTLSTPLESFKTLSHQPVVQKSDKNVSTNGHSSYSNGNGVQNTNLKEVGPVNPDIPPPPGLTPTSTSTSTSPSYMAADKTKGKLTTISSTTSIGSVSSTQSFTSTSSNGANGTKYYKSKTGLSVRL